MPKYPEEERSNMVGQYWSNQTWCDRCRQVVDVYTDDGTEYRCPFCGKKFTVNVRGEIID
jgi:DNA-directed RNA polymerase subunit RPC12/RpoP